MSIEGLQKNRESESVAELRKKAGECCELGGVRWVCHKENWPS